jgi:uncharacterized cupredoxin-like copper-binding protein
VLVIAADINAYHVFGLLLAVWAVVVSALGVMRHDFPGSKIAERIVIAISVVLVVGTIGAGVTTSGGEDAHAEGGEAEHAVNETGKEGSAAPGATIQTLTLSADPNNDLSFDKAELEAKAGRVRITMENPAQLPHDVSLEGPGGVDEQGEEVPQGGASEVEADVQPGEYTFYCSVDGHRDGGMEGTLTVTE